MLRVEGLRRRAGAFELCIDEWALERGRYLVLVGPSGAGKTMFLETVAGLHRPEAGRICIDGRDVTHEPPETRGIGFVYQDCWLFPNLTVRQNIDFGRRYHRRPHPARAPETRALAEMLHISGLLDRKPATLSGGERQRAALARALAIHPRLLFLDEPLGNLDPLTRDRVAAELRNCHRAFGTTTIHVTHDHTEARMLGDVAAVILDGRLEQMGPTGALFRRPRTLDLARFLGCENVFRAEVVSSVGPNTIRVQLGETMFELTSPLRGPLAICVRPEDVLVEPARGAPDAATACGDYNQAIVLTGRIVEVTPCGAMVRLLIAVGSRRWVSLISQSQQRSRHFGTGDTVKLLVPADAVHPVPSA